MSRRRGWAEGLAVAAVDAELHPFEEVAQAYDGCRRVGGCAEGFTTATTIPDRAETSA